MDGADALRATAPAVLVCLVRAIALTSGAGYSLGQELGRHDGPPLVDGPPLAANLALFTALAAVTWLELALLQTRPQAGLVITAVWSAGLLALGLRMAATDGTIWLVPAAVLALPPLASLVGPAAWRLPGRSASRPEPRRSLRLLLVHAAGVAALIGVWSEPMATSGSAHWSGTAVVVAVWALLATRPARETPNRRTGPSDPYVSTQVALVVGLAVLTWTAAN